MELTLSNILNLKKDEVSVSMQSRDELSDLKLQLQDIKEQMVSIETRYNLAYDEDMIECHIYEMKALDAQYRYIYKKLRGISVGV